MKRMMTLNKAAVVMKNCKLLSRNIYQSKVIAYPVDAIAAKNPHTVENKLIETVDTITKDIDKVFAAQDLFSEIKQTIIQANVETGLHGILCEIDHLKNRQQYLKTLLEATAGNSLKSKVGGSIGSTIITQEDIKTLALNAVCQNISEEITRVDSKVSSVLIHVEVPGLTENDLKQKIKDLTRAISDLEDKKYEINNTTKISVEIPDIIVDELGL